MPPTYEYECPDCDHLFEEFQSMSSPLLKKCPKCGRRKLRRLFGTGSGIIFKGSGFYETDYRRKSGGSGHHGKRERKKDGAESDPGSGRKSESESEAKPETKPESKPESKPETRPETRHGSTGKDSKKRD